MLMIQILSEIRMQHYNQKDFDTAKIIFVIIENIWKEIYQNAYICVGVFMGNFDFLLLDFPVSTCQLPHQPFTDNRNLKNEYPMSDTDGKPSVLIYLILTIRSLAHTTCAKHRC